MKQTLEYLFAHNTLTRDEAKTALTNIGSGKYSEAEIASFLTVYSMRKITAEEFAGFRDAMLDLAVKVDIDGSNAIDVCGTGGDGKHTFNISTLTAFTLAGAGIKVVKHGNYGASSPCGSSNIFESSGYKFSNETDKLKNELDKANICYMHAPLFHPAMKYVGPVRKALKVKTFFNILGPMLNPIKPAHQLVGVYSEEVLDLYDQVYKMGNVSYAVVYSLGGYDEISLTSPFKLSSRDKNATVSPADMGFQTCNASELEGGETVEESLKMFVNILSGKGTQAQTNAVIANASVALTCIYPEKSFQECNEIAKESIESGKAFNTFKELMELNIQ